MGYVSRKPDSRPASTRTVWSFIALDAHVEDRPGGRVRTCPTSARRSSSERSPASSAVRISARSRSYQSPRGAERARPACSASISALTPSGASPAAGFGGFEATHQRHRVGRKHSTVKRKWHNASRRPTGSCATFSRGNDHVRGRLCAASTMRIDPARLDSAPTPHLRRWRVPGRLLAARVAPEPVGRQ